MKMQGLYTESYMPLGDILIRQNFSESIATAYYRELDIGEAIDRTKFTIGGVKYEREIFSSAQDNIFVIRLNASGKQALTFDVSAKSQLRYNLSAN